MKKIKMFMVSFFLVCWSATSSAVPITVDFGFTGPPVDGVSGTGFFTVDSLVGTANITQFVYTGTCFGVSCSFGLSDGPSGSWNFSNANAPEFSIGLVRLVTTPDGFDFENFQITSTYGNYDGIRANNFGQLTDVSRRLADVDDGWDFTVRGPEPIPVPATLFLVGLGMAGLGISRKTRSSKG